MERHVEDIWLRPDELMMMEYNKGAPGQEEFVVFGVGNVPAASFRRLSKIYTIKVRDIEDPDRYYGQIRRQVSELAIRIHGGLPSFAGQSEWHAFEYAPVTFGGGKKSIIFYELLDRRLLKEWDKQIESGRKMHTLK
jgi:hypothetical protein